MINFHIEAIQNIINLKLSKSSFALFLSLCSLVTVDNKIPYTVKDLSKILNKQQNHLYKYLKELIENGILYKIGEYYYIDRSIIKTDYKKESVLDFLPDEDIILTSDYNCIFESDYGFLISKNYIYKRSVFGEEKARTINKAGKELLKKIINNTENHTEERHNALILIWNWYTKEGYNEQ